MLSQLIKPVVYLKGVGPAKAEKYERLGVKTVYDLLCDYPRDYLDLTQPVAINDAPANEQALIRGRIFKKLQPAMIRRGLTIYRAAVTDDTADLTIVIYNTGYAFDKDHPDQKEPIQLHLGILSAEERQILLEGCLMNYYRTIHK